MSALAQAIAHADDRKHHGNGYTLHIRLASGEELHGAVMRFDDGVAFMELWEKKSGDFHHATQRSVFVDERHVAAVEVCW
jgi:hypothetical protein